MGKINLRKVMLQTLAVLIVSISLIGNSMFTSTTVLNRIFFPLIHNLDPVGAEFDSGLLITEIMYNPAVQEPEGEWIELFNRSSRKIDLAGHKIGDSETQGDSEGMYQFPHGAGIEPGQVILIANQALAFSQNNGLQPNFELSDSDPFVPDLAKYRDWAGGVINLNNSGDEILLLDKDNNILDTISWGNSLFAFDPPAPLVSDDQSLERRPGNSDRNRSGDWFVQPDPQPGIVDLIPPTPEPTLTPTATLPSCHMAALLITEVMFDPIDSSDPVGEWIELFNLGDAPVQLECLAIGDEETKGGGEGMLSFPQNSTILADAVIVIANQAADFNAIYGFNPDFEFNDSDKSVPDMVKLDVWASGSLNLSNSGDEILLIGDQEILIDVVSWGRSTFAFNPSVPTVNAGRSIARRPADQDTNSAGDWVKQIDPQPGSVQLDLPSPTPTIFSSPTSTNTSLPLPPSPTNTPTPTVTPTPQPALNLVINEIQADPHSSLGDANYDGIVDTEDDEFIEFVNASSSSMDLSGLAIADALTIRHIFPPGSILAPNCGMVLFGGGTPDGIFGNSLVQIASNGKLGLNDHADNVYLYDESMTIIKTLSYAEEAGDNQSITRVPDIIGEQPFVKHSLAAGSSGSLFSPGTKIDGSYFSGCTR